MLPARNRKASTTHGHQCVPPVTVVLLAPCAFPWLPRAGRQVLNAQIQPWAFCPHPSPASRQGSCRGMRRTRASQSRRWPRRGRRFRQFRGPKLKRRLLRSLPRPRPGGRSWQSRRRGVKKEKYPDPEPSSPRRSQDHAGVCAGAVEE